MRTTCCASEVEAAKQAERSCAKTSARAPAIPGRWTSFARKNNASRSSLAPLRDERAKLQRDINAIQQQAESSWATERMENALLRERINDIAAEVAKLAMPARRAELAD